ncbi:MAG: sulfurtransferase TusA family protein [Deinococcales bacterium]
MLSSDPGSNKDIPDWVDKIGYELVANEDHGDYHRFVVRKSK